MKYFLILFSLSIASWAPTGRETYTPGKFNGTLNLHPIGDGIHMRVLERYAYTDGYGRSLEAAPGFISDGASIPRPLWSFAGSPFTGKYLNAAIIHDVGCESHKYPWRDTHRMFYYAMLDSEVGENYAKLLYYGVRIGGPKWKEVSVRSENFSEVSNEVARRGGSLTVNHDTSAAASDSLRPDLRELQVTLTYPVKYVSTADLKKFQMEIEARSNTRHPVSQEEIERKTEVEDAFSLIR